MSKRFTSLLLSVLMILAMTIVPVSADGTGTATLTITPSITTVEVGADPIVVNYSISVTPPAGGVIGVFSFTLAAPKGMTLSNPQVNDNLSYHPKFNPDGIFETFAYTEASGYFAASGTTADRRMTSGATVLNITGTIEAGLTGDFELTASEFIAGIDGSTKLSTKINATPVKVTEAIIPVTGVKLDKDTVSIQEGQNTTLTATVLPEKATNQNVTWSTDNAEVASVADGVVTAHKQGTATITVKTADGGKTASCKVTVTHVHDFKKIAAVEATCDKDGNNEYYHCKTCGKYYKADKVTETTPEKETIKALGHDPKDVVTKEPTCTEAGSKNVVCDRCGKILEENVVIPALGHDELEEKIVKAPTCTEAGEKQFICKRCGDVVKTETIAALGHDWSEWEEITDPDDPNFGKMKRTCKRCGREEITEHRISEDWNNDAVGHWHDCEDCDAKHDYAEHSFSAWEVVNPTETTNGYKKRTCSVCGYVYMETLPATGGNTPVTPVDPDPVEPEDDWKNPFTDVDKNDEYYDAVKFVNQNGLFYGTGDGTTFSPDMPMTRGMFVTVLSRLAKVDVSRYTTPSFADVPAGEWYAQAVEWAAENKIVLGYGDGNFGPNDQITVEQAAIILKNYAAFINKYVKSDAVIETIPGSADISDWAKEQMTWAVANDIYEGTNGVLYPTTLASRALVATMLQNFVNEILG